VPGSSLPNGSSNARASIFAIRVGSSNWTFGGGTALLGRNVGAFCRGPSGIWFWFPRNAVNSSSST